MGQGNHADVWAAFRDRAVVRGMCEDYRAGLHTDRVHEAAGRAAGRQIQCPMLMLVSADDGLDIPGDPETIWRPWTSAGLRSCAIHSGHHQAEEAPDELATALLDFLGHHLFDPWSVRSERVRESLSAPPPGPGVWVNAPALNLGCLVVARHASRHRARRLAAAARSGRQARPSRREITAGACEVLTGNRLCRCLARLPGGARLTGGLLWRPG